MTIYKAHFINLVRLDRKIGVGHYCFPLILMKAFTKVQTKGIWKFRIQIVSHLLSFVFSYTRMPVFQCSLWAKGTQFTFSYSILAQTYHNQPERIRKKSSCGTNYILVKTAFVVSNLSVIKTMCVAVIQYIVQLTAVVLEPPSHLF